jgi:hypothetical protein
MLKIIRGKYFTKVFSVLMACLILASCTSTESAKLPITSELQVDQDVLYGYSNSLYFQSLVLKKQTGCSFTFTKDDLTFDYNDGSSSVFPHNLFTNIVTLRNSGCLSYPYVSKNKTALACILNNKLVIVYSNDKGKTWNYSSPIDKTSIYAVNTYVSGTGFNDYFLSFISNNTGYLVLVAFSAANSAYSGL